MSAARYEVTLETCDGRRVLTALEECETALMSESVMRHYQGEHLTVRRIVMPGHDDARDRSFF